MVKPIKRIWLNGKTNKMTPPPFDRHLEENKPARRDELQEHYADPWMER